MRRLAPLIALVFGATSLPLAAAAQERVVIYRTAPPMNQSVEGRVRPQIEDLLEALAAEGRDYRLDGVDVFEAHDKFLPGKIASGMAHVLVATDHDDPAFADRVAAFRRLSELTLEDVNDSWGIYYYISALKQLKDAGLLEQCVDSETLEKLKTKLNLICISIFL